IKDPEVAAKVVRCEQKGLLGKRREILLRETGRCIRCGARLRPDEDAAVGKPGYVHIICLWCREHWGKTHCEVCGEQFADGRGTKGRCPRCYLTCVECGTSITEAEASERGYCAKCENAPTEEDQ